MTRLPLSFQPQPRQMPIEVDGAAVARELALDVAVFRQLMDNEKITVLCERGTGEDEGTWRVSFYHDGRRARFVVDARGRMVDTAAGS
ncbi:DUF6522 family protein [Pseudoxanthomonas beigongshangi]